MECVLFCVLSANRAGVDAVDPPYYNVVTNSSQQVHETATKMNKGAPDGYVVDYDWKTVFRAWGGDEREAEREHEQERTRLRDRRLQSKTTSMDADRTLYQADVADAIDAVDARYVARQTMVEKVACRGSCRS